MAIIKSLYNVGSAINRNARKIAGNTIDIAATAARKSNLPVLSTLASKDLGVSELFAGGNTVNSGSVPYLIGGMRTTTPSNSPTADTSTSGGLKQITLGASADGSSGGSGGTTDADAQRAAIEEARQRYMDYYNSQKDYAGRQLAANEQNINDLRTQAGLQAKASKDTLGKQNLQYQANINKQAQGAGLYDSSARVGAIGEQQQAFEDALNTLNTNEAAYYKNLDNQLTTLRDNYAMNMRELDISQFDKIQEFNDAITTLDEKIAANRAAAANASATAQSEFYKYLSQLPDLLDNVAPDMEGQVIQSFAEQYGADPRAVQQRVDISRAIKYLRASDTDSVTKKMAAETLRSLGIDPTIYGYSQ